MNDWKTQTTRRRFMQQSAAAAAVAALPGASIMAHANQAALFNISLAEWSLHRTLKRDDSGKDNLKFPVMAKEEFGIDAVEYVNQFFKTKANDEKYLNELKKICTDMGVKSLLIMCDGEGALGDADVKNRKQAVENHYKWVEAAKHLGCHSIRVNAKSSGGFEEQQKRAADGLRQLTEFGDKHEINVIVENHGGLSSNGEWLAGVMKMVDHSRCGTLPDFGNFRLEGDKWYDRYKGVDELMPYAKAVSAKSHDFDASGNDTGTDYHKMMDIVINKHDYHGWVGIEYEGGKLSEPDGIMATKKLLLSIRDKMSKK